MNLQSKLKNPVRIYLFVFLLLAIGIAGGGYLAFVSQEKEIKRNAEGQLSAIANLKSSQIIRWRNERTNDALFILNNPIILVHVREFLEDSGSRGTREEILKWMESFQKHISYKSVFLFDSEGTLRLSVLSHPDTLGSHTLTRMLQAMRDKKPVFFDLHREHSEGQIDLDFLVPLSIPGTRDTTTLGLLLLRIDPNEFLFPLVQSWPTRSRTAETILIRREGDEMVFLNQLRHRKNTALTLRRPISEERLPVAMAGRGVEGMVEGLDYRGVPVLAAVLSIPDSPWFLIAKVDTEEIYAPIRERATLATVFVGLMILFAGAIVGVFERRQRAVFYRKQYETEREHKLLKGHYEQLVKHGHDVLLIINNEGNIVEANDRAVSTYGYERDELLSLNLIDLRTPDSRATVKTELTNMIKKNGIGFQTEHRRKDGTVMIVDVSSRPFDVEGKSFIHHVVRDVTERKQTEQTLRKLSSAVANTADSVVITDRDGVIEYVNAAFERNTGFTKAEAIGKTPRILKSGIHPKEFYENLWQTILAGKVFKAEFTNKKKSGELYYTEETISTIVEHQGKISHFVSTGRDVTERKSAEAVLEESERRYRDIVDNSLVGVYQTNLKGDILYVNDAMARMLEFDSPEEMVSTRVVDLYEDLHDRDFLLEKLRKSGKVANFDTQLLTKKGNHRDVLLSVSLKDGLMSGMIRDVTERREAEKAVRESEERFRDLVESTTDWVWETDENFLFTYVSPKIEETLGYPPKEVLGKTPFDLMPPEEAKRAAAEAGAIAKTLRPFVSLEAIHLHHDGRKVVFETSGVPIFGAEGNFKGYRGLNRDITMRKQADMALQKSEEKYRTFFEEDLTGDFISTPEGKLLACNPAFARIFKFASVEDALKAGVYSLYKNPEERERFLRLLKKHKKLEYYEEEMCGLDGKPVYVVENAIGRFDEQGELVEIRGYIFDNTERHNIEKQMIKAQKMESIGTLAGGIAHDLNNVLGPIMLGIEIVRKGVQDERSLRMLDTMASSTERGAEILKQVLTFARGEEGEQKLLQPKHLVGEVVRLMEETFPKSIKIRRNAGKDIPTAVGDPTQLHQVLLNLCVNARDAMPKYGELKVGIERMDVDEAFARVHLGAKPGAFVVFSVTDTGMGMPQEVKDRIFEPFFTTKEIGKGTGLGLSTVSSIVKNHRGFITVYSEVGKGTTFRVYIPAAEEKEMKTKKASRKEIPAGRGELIMIVDDEDSIREITKATLEHYGYRVVTANDGAEALGVYTKQQAEIKLVITDMMMPIMDGPQTIHALRKINPKVKVIAVSGLASNGKTGVISEEEVGAFIRKPYSADTILLQIAKALRSAE